MTKANVTAACTDEAGGVRVDRAAAGEAAGYWLIELASTDYCMGYVVERLLRGLLWKFSAFTRNQSRSEALRKRDLRTLTPFSLLFHSFKHNPKIVSNGKLKPIQVVTQIYQVSFLKDDSAIRN